MVSKKTLQIALLAGVLYFFTVAIVHFLGLKIPVLYVYYDVSSTVYQDRIISVLSFAFAVFLYAGSKHQIIVKYILFAGSIAVFGLLMNNFLTKITFKNNPIYWLEIGLLGLYLLSIFILNKK